MPQQKPVIKAVMVGGWEWWLDPALVTAGHIVHTEQLPILHQPHPVTAATRR